MRSTSPLRKTSLSGLGSHVRRKRITVAATGDLNALGAIHGTGAASTVSLTSGQNTTVGGPVEAAASVVVGTGPAGSDDGDVSFELTPSGAIEAYGIAGSVTISGPDDARVYGWIDAGRVALTFTEQVKLGNGTAMCTTTAAERLEVTGGTDETGVSVFVNTVAYLETTGAGANLVLTERSAWRWPAG